MRRRRLRVLCVLCGFETASRHFPDFPLASTIKVRLKFGTENRRGGGAHVLIPSARMQRAPTGARPSLHTHPTRLTHTPPTEAQSAARPAPHTGAAGCALRHGFPRKRQTHFHRKTHRRTRCAHTHLTPPPSPTRISHPTRFYEYLGTTMSALGTRLQILSQTMSTLGTKPTFLSSTLHFERK